MISIGKWLKEIQIQSHFLKKNSPKHGVKIPSNYKMNLIVSIVSFFSTRLYIMSPFPHLTLKQLSNLMWLWSHHFSEIALSEVTESIFIAKDVFRFLSYVTFELYSILLVLAFLKRSLSLLSMILFVPALVFVWVFFQLLLRDVSLWL